LDDLPASAFAAAPTRARVRRSAEPGWSRIVIAAAAPARSRADVPLLPLATSAAVTLGCATVQADKPNPSTRLDLTLGIIVLTFHDASGQVIATTPTRQQLDTHLVFGPPKQAAKPGHGAKSDSGLAMFA
jgi:hypothetical protein